MFFPDEKFDDLVFNNNYWNNKLTLVLPHPSPLNKKWLKDHPDFMNKRIVDIRKTINEILDI
jgi:uracil-DNA glycosylase